MELYAMAHDPAPSYAAALQGIRPLRRLAWLTDLHLNFVTASHVERLCRSVAESGADSVLLTGDIGEAHDVEEHREAPDAELGLPIDRVLGNRDPGPSWLKAPEQIVERSQTQRGRLVGSLVRQRRRGGAP